MEQFNVGDKVKRLPQYWSGQLDMNKIYTVSYINHKQRDLQLEEIPRIYFLPNYFELCESKSEIDNAYCF